MQASRYSITNVCMAWLDLVNRTIHHDPATLGCYRRVAVLLVLG